MGLLTLLLRLPLLPVQGLVNIPGSPRSARVPDQVPQRQPGQRREPDVLLIRAVRPGRRTKAFYPDRARPQRARRRS